MRRLGRRPPLLAIAATVAVIAIYWLTETRLVATNTFVRLADAFLHGRLHLLDNPTYLELVARPEGGSFVPFPPMPAIMLLPFVALFGSEFDQGIAAAIFGGANVYLLWHMLESIDVPLRPRRWLTVAFAFGSVHWWAAGVGSLWLLAHVIAVLFLLVALILGVRQERPVLAGIALGCAAAARLPVGLTLPLFVALYGDLRFPPRRPDRARLVAVGKLLAGLAIPAALVGAYNLVRLGNPLDFGYDQIPGVGSEPWFESGLLSPSYIPRHLHTMFLRSFDFVEEFPWFRPNWNGTSLLLTTPILLWLVKARSRAPLIVYGWIAVAFGLLPNLMHGSWGFTQFGYRFILDVAPILWLMLGWVFAKGISKEARFAVAFGVLVNAYGIWAITVADFVAY